MRVKEAEMFGIVNPESGEKADFREEKKNHLDIYSN